jgi:N-methylhydantoinase B
MISPITLEVIRHRLVNVNEDASSILRRVSGSQIAVEANDLNTVIMAPDGRVIACGRYVLIQTASMHLMVNNLIENYSETPGIRPGDQFITNDPYIATLHQPDVIVAAPIFVADELVGWCASVVHQSDVGGPTPGGISYDARSIFDEAIPMAPVKIVEGDKLRRDIEREYLIRSRTPELNALDLAGQIAANRETIKQISALCDRYSKGIYLEAVSNLLDNAEGDLRRRLLSLRNGTFRHRAYVTHRSQNADGAPVDTIYAVALTMKKVDDTLILDFSTSDPQAPGAINTTRPALINFSLGAILIYLCNGLPWIPGALWPVIEIRSKEGTVTHAKWPAGVAMSTSATGQAVRVCVNACVARLLQASQECNGQLMASCQFAGAGACVISGERSDHSVFATMTTDDMSGGGGARFGRDGADSSGFTTSPGASIANVEVSESYLPIRYIYRRELVDSAGAGTWRGGVGSAQLIVQHDTPVSLRILSFGQGMQYPPAIGVGGGWPGGSSAFAILPSDERRTLLSASLPHPIEMPAANLQLGNSEFQFIASQGGGGLGEPLSRTPQLVVSDMEEGLVSQRGAEETYGVIVVKNETVAYPKYGVNEHATQNKRQQLRRMRLNGVTPKDPVESCPGQQIAYGINETKGNLYCSRCATLIATSTSSLWEKTTIKNYPTSITAPFSLNVEGATRFSVRAHSCPGCAESLDVQVVRVDEPSIVAFEFD